MFVLQAQDGRFYNGRAADWDGNLTTYKDNAFLYRKREVADKRATTFNSFTSVHGLKFDVVEIN